jgi:heat-inducible transcriptional repressor
MSISDTLRKGDMEKWVNMNKRAGRKDREKKILFSLVEHYLRTGKPVGSQSLQEEVLADISPATIRNYFVSLEHDGYLKQQHLSGGRVPQARAFVEYAKQCFDELANENSSERTPLPIKKSITSHDVVTFLQLAADCLSQQAGAPVAITSPRFDHDVITEVKFVFLDVQRTLAVITTEFGFVHTAVLYSAFPFSLAFLKKADRFAKSRLFREVLETDFFEGDELDHVLKLYQEAMASYFVSYSSISQEDIWRTGFSHLLTRPEFEETHALSAPLSLFENANALRGFSRDAIRSGHLRFWIGEELSPYAVGEPNCAVISIPYNVGNHPVGALTIIGSMRVFYLELFRLMRDAAEQLSSVLTNCFVHNRMTYRMPESRSLLVKEPYTLALDFYKNPEKKPQQP